MRCVYNLAFDTQPADGHDAVIYVNHDKHNIKTTPLTCGRFFLDDQI